MAQVASLRIVGDVADRLLATDLPQLPAERRAEVVRFVARRVDTMPGPLPLVGEFPRLVRSLGFAYIWETWPDTSPSGAPA